LADRLGFSHRLAVAGVSEPQALDGRPQNAREPRGFSSGSRAALPAVMSRSPTRLVDDFNVVQSLGDFKTALLP
jgi:hypothetical protein